MARRRRRPSPRAVRRRRQTWMDRRRARGLSRPLPLGVLEVNAMSVSAGPKRAKAILERAAELVVEIDGVRYPVDYILGCEGDDFDAQRVLGREWDAHHDQSHPDKDGAFQAIRRSRGYLSDEHVVRASDPLRGVLPARWISVALVHVDPGSRHVWFFKGASAHLAPKRAWARWAQGMAALRRVRADVVGADFNKTLAAVASAYGRRVGGHEVLFLATRWRIPVSEAVAVDVGGDHKAVFRVLWP